VIRAARGGGGGFRRVLEVFRAGRRIGKRGGSAEQKKVAEGSLEHDVEAGFVAVEDLQLPAVGEAYERACEGGVAGVGDIVVGFLPFELLIDSFVGEAGFDAPRAALAPERGGHFLDEAGLDGVGWGEALAEGGEEALEILVGLVCEHDACGEEAVSNCVLGRAGLTGGCYGAFRAGTVSAGRSDASG